MSATWRERARAKRPEARIVETASGRAVCYCGTDAALEVLETCPGARYVSANQLRLAGEPPEAAAWLLLPCDRTSLLLVETVGKVFWASDDYIAARRELLAVDMAAAHLYPEAPEGLPTPFRHQIECFSAALCRLRDGAKGFSNWMDMGLGKSRWLADFMNATKPRVSLILIRKITRHQMACCVENVFPEATLVPLFGTLKERGEIIRGYAARLAAGEELPPIVFLLNWDVLYRLEKDLLKLEGHLDLIAGDEITKIANRTSQVSKSARKLARVCGVRIPMTGTPGHPKNIWALMQFQDETLFPMSYWDFMKRYFHLGGFTGWEFDGFRPERLPELIDTLYRNAYRQTKATATDMPPKTYQVVELPMKREQRDYYQRVAKEYGATIEVPLEFGAVGVGELTVGSAIARTTRLQQIAAGILPLTTLTVGEGEEQQVYGGGYREIESAKTEWVVEYVREQVEVGDTRGIIWTKFQPEADRLHRLLAEAGVEAPILDGRTKDTDRNPVRKQIQDRFNDANSDLRWIIVNTSAGAYGLDAPLADVMLMHSSTYDILERQQLEDRGHRAGRTRPYLIIDLILKGTVDRDIYNAYQRDLSLISMYVNKGIAA